jgi:hypothetical protein
MFEPIFNYQPLSLTADPIPFGTPGFKSLVILKEEII